MCRHDKFGPCTRTWGIRHGVSPWSIVIHGQASHLSLRFYLLYLIFDDINLFRVGLSDKTPMFLSRAGIHAESTVVKSGSLSYAVNYLLWFDGQFSWFYSWSHPSECTVLHWLLMTATPDYGWLYPENGKSVRKVLPLFQLAGWLLVRIYISVQRTSFPAAYESFMPFVETLKLVRSESYFSSV